MKIITRKEFMELPEGKICQKYEPCVFGNPFIKGETYRHDNGEPFDYIYDSIISNFVDGANSDRDEDVILTDALENGTEFRMDPDATLRDGLFDEDQLYVLWDSEDIKRLYDKIHSIYNM